MALNFLPPGTAEPRPCGGCSMCCKLITVRALKKPPNRWCQHCDVGRGCRIYGDRPNDCRVFQCLWTLTPGLPEQLRPDRSRVMLEATDDGEVVLAMVDPGRPDAWQRGWMHRYLVSLVDRNVAVMIVRLGTDADPIALLPRGRTMEAVRRSLESTRDAMLQRETKEVADA